MNETAIGIVGGAVVAIVITIIVETLRRPKLSMRIAETGNTTYPPGRPASSGQYLNIELINEPLPWLFRWLSRDAALQCRGTITFHTLDGHRYFSTAMPVRFVHSPEPVPMQIVMGNQTGILVDPLRLSLDSRIDIYPGESSPFDIAAKFDADTDCYAWSNLNYFSMPAWRHPDWKLPPGRYLIEATILSSSAKSRRLFRLFNQGGPKDFRLEKAMPTDRVIHPDIL